MHLNFNVPYFPIWVNFLPVFAPAYCLPNFQNWFQPVCFRNSFASPLADWWIGWGLEVGGNVEIGPDWWIGEGWEVGGGNVGIGPDWWIGGGWEVEGGNVEIGPDWWIGGGLEFGGGNVEIGHYNFKF